MTRSSRTSNVPFYVAIGVAVLALFVAATTTAYAAGLAKNSVGAKQIKSNAVRTAELKKGAVTADRIASGVVPAKTVNVARQLTLSGTLTPLLKLGGLSFDAACNSGLQDFVEVTVTRIGGGALTASGTFSIETSTSGATYPFVDTNTELEVFTMSPSIDGFGAITFDGVLKPTGQPAVLVQITVQVEDGTATPCQTFVTATPIG